MDAQQATDADFPRLLQVRVLGFGLFRDGDVGRGLVCAAAPSNDQRAKLLWRPPERQCLAGLVRLRQIQGVPRRATHLRAHGLSALWQEESQILALRGIVIFETFYCTVWYSFAAHLVTKHVFGRKMDGEVCSMSCKCEPKSTRLYYSA